MEETADFDGLGLPHFVVVQDVLQTGPGVIDVLNQEDVLPGDRIRAIIHGDLRTSEIMETYLVLAEALCIFVGGHLPEVVLHHDVILLATGVSAGSHLLQGLVEVAEELEGAVQDDDNAKFLAFVIVEDLFGDLIDSIFQHSGGQQHAVHKFL